MANDLKDRFLAVMSHELKQPLNLIQMNAELLMRLPVAAENPKVQRLSEAIRSAVGSQSRIINDLLDLSRIRTGKLRLNRVAVDLGELVQTAATAASPTCPASTSRSMRNAMPAWSATAIASAWSRSPGTC
jgi:two-component system CheB/CheR fusion protein